MMNGVELAGGVMAGLILICLKKEFTFSWKKLTVLGVIASFNKGSSGGGYGPVVTSGQILSGLQSRSTVGITSLAEGLTCLVGVICYVVVSKSLIDWKLAPFLIIGAVCSVPLSAKSVKLIGTQKLKLIIALLTLTLGALTIIKTLKTVW